MKIAMPVPSNIKPDIKCPMPEVRNLAGTEANILVWLPFPMGDAILCSPALRAVREHFKSVKITFMANKIVKEIMSPSSFNDNWLTPAGKNPVTIALELRKYRFSHAILFKNSFASALAVFLAGIPNRIGYAREKRSFMLTDKLYPPKQPDGGYAPCSMVDYYLAIASGLGAEKTDRELELSIEPQDKKTLLEKLPALADATSPIVILVPGGAFGPSKMWPAERFAQTAAWLINNYNATVVVSVAPDATEKKISAQICSYTKNKIISLADKPVTLGELKALFSVAALVITNDTGPRHIALALHRKVITVFGPNNPAWTETDSDNEIQIIGNVFCAPCHKKLCPKRELMCMQSITSEMVRYAAKKLLENNSGRIKIFTQQRFIKISESVFVGSDYQTAFDKQGLIEIEQFFSFNAAKKLTKKNLASFRSRVQFEVDSPTFSETKTLFMKRYDHPPVFVQIKNRLAAHSRKSCGEIEFKATQELNQAGINTPKVAAYGTQWGKIFEKRSFIVTEKVPDAEALERNLPAYFQGQPEPENLKLRRNFIAKLAGFINKFHRTDYRHRDLYFSHIFYSDTGSFYLIDLARAFKPIFLKKRFQVKDIAQLYYSAPGRYFTNSDRLRFYIKYTGRKKLTNGDRTFIRSVIKKAKKMVEHDKKHGKQPPFKK